AKIMRGLLQPMHILVILVIVLIIFGPGKLPELGSAIGKAIRGFKRSMEDTKEKIEDAVNADKTENKKD
ncbi:MAG: twin-arginine translocase TatA/TatE family subunit, partial [Syntrophales bacterium]